MDAKGVTPANKVYLDFEPSMEWAWEHKCGTLLLYLPGFSKEQLRVQVIGTRMLRLSGERPIGGERWSRFHKEVQIPKNCNPNGITAKFEGGILFVQHPKTITPAEQQEDMAKPQRQSPKPPKPAVNVPQSQRETQKAQPSKPIQPHSQASADIKQDSSTTAEKEKEEEREKEKDKDKDNDKDKEKEKDPTAADNVPNQTWEEEDEKDTTRASEERGNVGHYSKQNPSKVEGEATKKLSPCGSGKSTLENYTKVVGRLAMNVKKGGKLMNFVVGVLLALVLGLYVTNTIKSYLKPKI